MAIIDRLNALMLHLCSLAGSVGATALAGAAKDVTEAADHLTAAQRNLIESKVQKKQLEQLERLERRLSTVTLAEVERFDPKVDMIHSQVRRSGRSAAKKRAATATMRTPVRRSAAKSVAKKKAKQTRRRT